MILFQKVASDKSKKTRCFYSKKGFFALLKVKPVWKFNQEKIRLACSDRHGIAGKCDDRLFTFVLTVQ